MLTYDPSKRISPCEALNHDFFKIPIMRSSSSFASSVGSPIAPSAYSTSPKQTSFSISSNPFGHRNELSQSSASALPIAAPSMIPFSSTQSTSANTAAATTITLPPLGASSLFASPAHAKQSFAHANLQGHPPPPLGGQQQQQQLMHSHSLHNFESSMSSSPSSSSSYGNHHLSFSSPAIPARRTPMWTDASSSSSSSSSSGENEQDGNRMALE